MSKSKQRKEAVKRFAALALAFLMVFQYTAAGLSVYSWAEDNGEAAQEEQVEKAEEKAKEAPEPKKEEPQKEEKVEQKVETPAPAPEPEPAPQPEEVKQEETQPEEKAEEPEQPAEEKGEEKKEEEEEEEEEKYPAQDFQKTASGVVVRIAAPEGALPEGATVVVTPVSAKSVEKSIEKAAGDVKVIKAMDISFRDKDGKEIEPKKQVSVNFQHSSFSAMENPEVFHIKDSGAVEKVADNKVGTYGNQISMNAKDFSIYAVVDGETPAEDARLTVRFVKADGTEVEMMITPAQAYQINEYIYDPGAGTVPTGATFKGWTATEEYTADTESMTIGDVREAVLARLNEGVSEGDEVTYYAMTFNSYTVTYLDEEGVTLKNDRKLYRTNDEDAHEYTVNLAYTPYVRDEDEAQGITAEFDGWQLIDPAPEEKVVYDNEQVIELTSNIKLRATVLKGYWISYNENISGATYTMPELVSASGHPTKPADPTCTGYTFGGWYTEDASGERDGQVAGDEVTDFSSLTLTKNTTLHAKWTENSQASYSILIWKQRVSGTGYDFEESVTVNNGTVGSVINTVTAQGNGDGRYARVNGTNKQYTGFHLDRFDQNVTIKSDGTSVLNVYYNRNEITLTFRYREGGQWHTQATMTGLYGQTLASQGYSWPTNRWWYDSYQQTYGGYSGAGTRTTFLDAFILSDGGSEQTFYGFAGNGSRNVYFYKQNADGEGYTLAQTAETSNGTFHISDKFSGFHAASYSTNNTTWTTLGNKDSDGYYAAVGNYTNLYIRYDRDSYKILFMDGVYSTADQPERYNKSNEKLGEVDGIVFGSDVKSYKNYKDTQLQKEMREYVFLGWYADDKCETLYDFDTMPEGGITVYAKWLKKAYEVNLHNNAEGDPSFKYNSETQAEQFWPENGEKIANVGGERTYYDLVGWYTDAELTHSFDFDTFIMNDDTIRRYGTMYTEDQIDPEYVNTVGKIDLYAKWRSKLVGANGINIRYDATSEGTNAPTDSNNYVDLADAIAQGASESTNEHKVFSNWVVQKWNGTAFEDTNEKLFPGDTFVVKADYAKIFASDDESETAIAKDKLDPKGSYKYIVQLKAEYIEAEKPLATYLNWYDNYGGIVDTTENMEINQAVDVPAAPTRNGYIFKGWIRGVEETEASTTTADHTTTLKDLFITYADGAYDKTKVAADERLVNDNAEIGSGDGYTYHHAMYAKWEPISYTVRFNKNAEDAEGTMADQEFKFDEEKALTENAFTRENYKFLGWSTSASATTAEYTNKQTVKNLTTENGAVVNLYAVWELDKATVTVHHYLKGTTTKVAEDVTSEEPIGSEYTAQPVTTYQEKDLTVDTYNPSQKVTVSADGNVITIYYTLPLTITAKTDSKTYDGTPLNGAFTVEGALDSDKTAIERSLGTAPSITNVSESPKQYQATVTEVPGYYAVTNKPGTLTINPITDKVTVTITEHSGTETYDGTEKTVSGYDAVANNAKYDVTKDFSFKGTDSVSGTNAGSYPMDLKAADFTNTNTNFSNVEFVIEDGTLTINPKEVTVTADDKTKVYGAADPELTATVEGTVGTDTVLYTLSREIGENVGTYKITPTGAIEQGNYKVTFVPGTLEITAETDKVTVTITEKSGSEKYDGTEKTVTGYTVDIDNELYTENDFTFTGDATVKGTDAGSYPMELKPEDFENTNTNFTNVEFVIVDGTLEIAKRNVTLTSADDEKVYDGAPLTNDEVTVGGDGFATGEDATYDVTGTITEVGETPNAFTYTLNEGTKAANYNITKTEGTLTVTEVTDKVTVTITEHSGSEKYDGSEKEVKGYDVEISNKLYTEDDFTFSGNAEVKGTDAGSYPMELKTSDFANTNKNFTNVEFVIVDGTLEIAKRTVTLTSASDNKAYDGTPLTNDTVTEGGEGFAEGEGATYEVTGTQTEEGTSDNTFTYTLNEGTKADNYEISKTIGKLTVTANEDEVVVTITENSGSEKYDGSEKKVTGYTVEISNELYTENDFTFSGDATITGTDAGTYDMELTADDFQNTSKNFSNVTFVIVDGTLEIAKRTVTLTSASAEKVYDGTPLTTDEVAVAGDGFAEGEGATFDVTGTQTEKGSSANTFTYTLNEGTKADNYEISTEEGTLTVTAVTEKVTVTITEKSGEEKYDGTEKSVKGYTVEISNKLYTEDDFTFSGNDEVKGTDAGTYEMELSADDFENISENFTNVEFKIVDGTLEIAKRTVTLTSEDDEKEYDGTPLTNDKVTVTGDGFVEGEVSDIKATGSQTNAGSSTNTIEYTEKESFKADNYEISKEEGTLTVTKAEIPEDPDDPDDPKDNRFTATVPEDVVYNGKEQKQPIVVTDTKTGKELTEDDITITYTEDVTNVGRVTVTITANEDGNYTGEFTRVYNITPAPLTITTGSDEKEYDGTPLTKDEAEIEGLVNGETATIKATGSQTNAGESDNTYELTWDGTAKESNYEIKEEKLGTLTVTKAKIPEDPDDPDDPKDNRFTATVPEDVVYNGKEQKQPIVVTDTKTGKELTVADVTITYSDDVTNVGEVTVTIKATEDGNYEGEFTRKYNITKAPLTITTGSDEKVYDGEALTKDEAEIEGLVNDETATIKATGSQTQVGSSDNTYELTWDGTAKESNYEIKEEKLGTLTVTKAKLPDDPDDPSDPGNERFEVSTPEDVKYDGQEHKQPVTVTDKKTGKELTEDDITITYSEDVTNAGTVTVTIKANEDGNYSGEFTRTYKINPREVTLTSESDSKEYDGTALEKPEVTVTGDGFVEGEVSDIKATGSQTDAGSSTNTIEYTEGANFKADNYKITKNEGTLEVTKAKIPEDPDDPKDPKDGRFQATVPEDVTYNGKEQKQPITVTDTKTGKELVEGKDYEISYSPAKNAGTVTVTIKGIGNYEGEFTRTYKINPKLVTIRTNSATKVFDGTALKAKGRIKGIVAGETVSFKVTGSRTAVGKSKNTYSLKWNGTALKSNYTITSEVIGTLRVTPRPPVPDDDNDNNPGPNPPAPTVVINPPVTPEIDDTPAPEVAPEPEIVDPEPSPAAVNEGFWALINLICAIVSVLLSLFILVRYLGKGKKNVDDDEQKDAQANAQTENADADEQKQQKIKKKGLLRIMDIIPAVASVITFILTEDMSQPMQLVDQWTLLMVVILLVDVVLAIFTKRTTKDLDNDNEEQEQNTQA